MIANKLFQPEINIFEAAMQDIQGEEYLGNTLLAKYALLAKEYRKLLKLTQKVFKISDTQGKELKRRASEIKDILDHANQGFLTFGGDLHINSEYSAECLSIFDKKIAGDSVVKLLCEDSQELEDLLRGIFHQIFMTENLEIKKALLKKLPSMLKIGDSYIDVKYTIINSVEDIVDNDRIMLILTDITEKRKAEDQVLYLSYHDKLTSLHNRAYVESIMPQLQVQSMMPLSIIMADMNGLKLTNDVFGHVCGDKLLANAGYTLKAASKNKHIVARWGGDEFLMILPNTDSLSCKEICENIQDLCREIKPDPIQLSLSLGSATMENAQTQISELLNVAENRMYSNKVLESKEVRRKIIMGMEQILYQKCYLDTGHIVRMKKMAINFATILGFDANSIEMKTLILLANLHDIGKVAIPKEILGKIGSLTKNEWDIMKTYTEIGFRMAQSIEEPFLAQGILSMRESWDGSGYPYGLKQEQIPYISRIAAILEAYDVMTHGRPYKETMEKEKAISEIKDKSGIQFDPQLVKMFIKYLDEVI
jgi:diguanylate cyclase (GGDEF)-like protein